MLLLVTIVLVLVAAVTLLIGIFSDNLALIFISIGASALAAIVLGVLSQVSKRKGREATPAAGPEPLPTREPATVGGGRDTAEQAADDIATIGEPVGGATSDAPTATMPAVGGGALPIANYDSLRVNEILPALGDLDLDQLEAVAQHEESNKNRTTVLNRIDDLMDELEAQGAEDGTAAVDLTDTDEAAAAAVESIETVGEPVVAASSGSAAPDGFPIPNYDELDEDELIDLLEDLDADELEAVADREEAGQNRDAVLDAIDDRLDILEGIVPAPPTKATSAPTKVPARSASKAPAKAAKKAASKKVTPPTATRKATAPTTAKKAAAKKAASAPARTSAAPAKKTATTKAAASRTPAKKATTAAKAPAKKATTAAKATKKSATTAKKATAAKRATKR